MLSCIQSTDRHFSKSYIKSSIIYIKKLIDEINPDIQKIYNKYSYFQVINFDIYSLITIIDSRDILNDSENDHHHININDLHKILIFKILTRLVQVFESIKFININNQLHYFEEYDNVKRKINNLKTIAEKYNK